MTATKTSSEPSKRPNWERFKPVLFGIATTLALMWGSHRLESTTFGRWLEFNAYQVAHWQLPTFREDDPLPVVVVDIEELSSNRSVPTSRPDLLALIQAIAAEKPAAIGVDIDFSPNDDANDHDAKVREAQNKLFFEECWKITRGSSKPGGTASPVPIFLGVGRGLKKGQQGWFFDRKYNDMAAAIRVKGNDTRRMPRWFAAEGQTGQLKTLAEALAEKYTEAETLPLPSPRPIFHPLLLTLLPDSIASRSPVGGEVEREEGLTAGVSFVNYSELELLNSAAHVVVGLKNPEDVPIAATKIPMRGRMVLIGDAVSNDHFAPNSPFLPIRGVILHACAAYTFAKAPLFEFTPGVRIALDIFLSGLLLFAFYKLSDREEKQRAVEEKLSDREEKRRAMQEKRQHLWRSGTHALILFAVLVLGWVLVRWGGVIWLDFLVIWFALAVHPYIEDGIDALEEKRQIFMEKRRNPVARLDDAGAADAAEPVPTAEIGAKP